MIQNNTPKAATHTTTPPIRSPLIKPRKEKNNIHFLAFLLLSAFILLKVYRAFSGEDAEAAGGPWNVIQIIFVLWGIVFLYQESGKLLTNGPILALLCFSVFAFVFALTYLTAEAQTKRIFDTFMLPYGAMMMIVFFEVGSRYGVQKNLLFVLAYYIAAIILISAMATFYNSGADLEDKGAVADVYYILGLLPLMLIYTPKKWVFLPILVCSIAVAFSGKRAGLLAIAAMLLIYFFTILSKSNMTAAKRIGLLLLIAIGLALLYNLLIYIDEIYHMRLFERMESLETDGGSGRDRLWARTINSLRSFDFIELLTGKGKGSVRDAIGIQAHNDFLHVLHEHGFFAVLFYVLSYIFLVREAIAMYRNKYPYAHLFLMSVVCSLFVAMFSFYIIYPTYCTGGMVCAGFFIGDHYRFKEENDLFTIRRKKNGRLRRK